MLQRFTAYTSTLRLEAVLVFVTLIGVGWLSATPVPVPAFAQEEIEAPTQTQTIDEIDVTLALSPGGPGVNTYDVLVERDGVAVTDATVSLVMVNPERDERSESHSAEPVENGLYVTADDSIDREGLWWSLVDVTVDGETRRFAYTWDITNEASVIQTRDPQIQNIVALLLVVLAAGWAISPLAKRTAAALNMDSASVTIAVGATAVTAAVLALGFVILQDAQERSRAVDNPPPEVVNIVLPGQNSLESGRALYTEHCIVWQRESRDFNELLDRLDRTRDDELYAMIDAGWRNLPPCTGEMDAIDRWHVVNYFRTLAN
jgi:hypothetical protein